MNLRPTPIVGVLAEEFPQLGTDDLERIAYILIFRIIADLKKQSSESDARTER